MRKVWFVCAVALLLAVVGAHRVEGAAFTLTSDNSTLVGDSNTMVYNWLVNGVDHLYEESWFYRLPGGTQETRLTGGTLATLPSVAVVTYAVPSWGTVVLTHSLAGSSVYGQSGWSTGFGFSPTNSTTPLTLFNYADYDLSNTISNESVAYLGNGRFLQTDNLTTFTWQLVTNGSITAHEISLYNSLITSLTDASLTTLNNANSGTGDVVFGVQLDGPPNYSIDRSLSPVPEPGSMLLLGGGLIGLAGVVRRRFAKK